MNKKIVSLSILLLLAQQQLYADNFGGGFATGAILGTGLTLAATSPSRAPRDPYYDVERAEAQQELRKIKAENRLRREEEREERRQQKQEEREERKRQKELKKEQRKKERNLKKKQEQRKKEAQSPRELELEIKRLELELAQLKNNA